MNIHSKIIDIEINEQKRLISLLLELWRKVKTDEKHIVFYHEELREYDYAFTIEHKSLFYFIDLLLQFGFLDKSEKENILIIFDYFDLTKLEESKLWEKERVVGKQIYLTLRAIDGKIKKVLDNIDDIKFVFNHKIYRQLKSDFIRLDEVNKIIQNDFKHPNRFSIISEKNAIERRIINNQNKLEKLI